MKCFLLPRPESGLKWPPSETSKSSGTPKLVGYIHPEEQKTKHDGRPNLLGYLHIPRKLALKNNSRSGSDSRLTNAFERQRQIRVRVL